jgi:hypothetical protein
MKHDAEHAVYVLKCDYETGDGEVLALATDSPSLLGGEQREDRLDDLCPDRPFAEKWVVPRVRKIWKPLKTKGRIRAGNDIQWVMNTPALSERAIAVLGPLIDGHCELLPIQTPAGQYWILHVTTVVDIVDDTRSKLSFPEEADRVVKSYDYYVLQEAALARSPAIFQMRNDPGACYVKQAFVDLVSKAAITNFACARIWPWPRGTNWVTENSKIRLAARKRRARRGQKGSRDESVIVCLKRSNDARSAMTAVRELMDKLDALLLPPDRSATIVGKLEGHEVVGREYRLFLSAPSAETLFRTIRPLVKELEWNGEVRVVQRSGGIHDGLATAIDVSDRL